LQPIAARRLTSRDLFNVREPLPGTPSPRFSGQEKARRLVAVAAGAFGFLILDGSVCNGPRIIIRSGALLHQRAPGDCNNALRQSSGAVSTVADTKICGR
jgi:hypothetical protein